MFIVNYLITEGGFDDYNSDTLNPDPVEQDPPKIEYSDIKKFILYEQLKQIHRTLNQLQFNNVDEEFHSILNFCQNIIEFFNSFDYPETVRLIDNLMDAIEEKLGLKLEKRIPYEFPEDLNTKPAVDPNIQQPGQPAQQVQQAQPIPPVQPVQAPVKPTFGNNPISITKPKNQFTSLAKQG